MNIVDALKKSNYLYHPQVYGFVIAHTGEWESSFSRLYVRDDNHFHTSDFQMDVSLIKSEDWKPVKIAFTVEDIND